MTTQEIANRLVELCREGKNLQAYEELFSEDAIAIEPAHTGIPDAIGKAAMIEKQEMMAMMIMEMHGMGVSDPLVSGNFFSCAMWIDAEMLGRDRSKLEEIAVYQVEDGKIVKEMFFF
jgi:hypothetical protein